MTIILQSALKNTVNMANTQSGSLRGFESCSHDGATLRSGRCIQYESPVVRRQATPSLEDNLSGCDTSLADSPTGKLDNPAEEILGPTMRSLFGIQIQRTTWICANTHIYCTCMYMFLVHEK